MFPKPSNSAILGCSQVEVGCCSSPGDALFLPPKRSDVDVGSDPEVPSLRATARKTRAVE